jgi:pimeloyl-ACP methyl ester carboxylesterase
MNHTRIDMPPEGRMASVNGIEMYYELHGEGTPLVLLHGFTGSTQHWQPFVADFAQEHQLILIDLRGHGRSTNPTNQFTHRQAALDVFALLDQLGIDTFKAIGASSGGMTLIHMATQQPSRVEAMVLIGAPSYIPDQARALNRQSKEEGWGDWEALRQRHVYGDEQIQALLDLFYGFKDVYDDMNFTPPYLSTITAQTLIMFGDRDAFFPVSIAVEMYAAIPHAYLWVVPNGDHVPIYDRRAAAFTQTALEFLRGEWETE